MEKVQTLGELRKDIQSEIKAIDMLEKLIERQKSKGEMNTRQYELYEISLKRHQDALSKMQRKEKLMMEQIEDLKKKGIISEHAPEID